ncbi:MAG: orotidine-5'-phosphate decarboxylase [Defluviitaleaceae bacterium]|nr:orotidine-5'-phosphate decarboxylase [Defluviitaleaceae bacterium]
MIDKLIDKITLLKNPSVVGLDPQLNFVPEHILEEMYDTYGHTPKAVSEAIFKFNTEIIDAVYDIVPAVKPQIAMYEMFGTEGIDAYIKTIKYAKSKNMFVIADAKRNDIASTGAAYAKAFLGKIKIGDVEEEAFGADLLTVSPYLGQDSLEPFIDECRLRDKGIFILVKTSNPGSGMLQDLLVDGKPIYEIVGTYIEEWGTELRGRYGFSPIGAVVGATHKEQAARLREIMPHTFMLVPGYGAQGGTAADLSVCFNSEGLGAIVNSSRGIIAAYKGKCAPQEHFMAAREAAIIMRDDIVKHI